MMMVFFADNDIDEYVDNIENNDNETNDDSDNIENCHINYL